MLAGWFIFVPELSKLLLSMRLVYSTIFQTSKDTSPPVQGHPGHKVLPRPSFNHSRKKSKDTLEASDGAV